MQDADGDAAGPAPPFHPARLDGNRVWRVDTSRGTVLQKLYAERGDWLRAWGREVFSWLRGAKTGTRAAARRATEARLLALWRQHGCDAPADVSTDYPELAGPRTLVLEFVEGPLLSDRLRDTTLAPAARAALLAAFGAAWGRRHRLALELREPALLQEHGTLQHVIVAGAPDAPHFVTFDHENAFARAGDMEAHVAKEVASVLPSLYRSQPRPDGQRLATEVKDAQFREDVKALVAGYGDAEPLRAACARYLQPRGPAWGLICRIDRGREERTGARAGKFRVLGLTRDVLR
ncbi:MAG TPA: hypothetical protein VFY71_08495 [Planctomycetota bacterium]|nr:hypothetical protein [Planctomycetota bacterium]